MLKRQICLHIFRHYLHVSVSKKHGLNVDETPANTLPTPIFCYPLVTHYSYTRPGTCRAFTNCQSINLLSSSVYPSVIPHITLNTCKCTLSLSIDKRQELELDTWHDKLAGGWNSNYSIPIYYGIELALF